MKDHFIHSDPPEEELPNLIEVKINYESINWDNLELNEAITASIDQHILAKLWCYKNCNHAIYVGPRDHANGQFWFTDPREALLFKLRWG